MTQILATAAAGLLLAAPATPPGGPDSTDDGAKVTVHATTVRAGGKVRVSGSKWRSKGSRVQRGAQVTIKLDDTTVLAVLPIRNKRFEGSVPIPAQTKPGRHWLRFLASDPPTSVKSRAFRVTGR